MKPITLLIDAVWKVNRLEVVRAAHALDKTWLLELSLGEKFWILSGTGKEKVLRQVFFELEKSVCHSCGNEDKHRKVFHLPAGELELTVVDPMARHQGQRYTVSAKYAFQTQEEAQESLCSSPDNKTKP